MASSSLALGSTTTTAPSSKTPKVTHSGTWCSDSGTGSRSVIGCTIARPLSTVTSGRRKCCSAAAAARQQPSFKLPSWSSTWMSTRTDHTLTPAITQRDSTSRALESRSVRSMSREICSDAARVPRSPSRKRSEHIPESSVEKWKNPSVARSGKGSTSSAETTA
eukprot:Amastigsp_a677882_7.p4 type:complete len:164 gc:universal Amastigsp_a677882_7:739-248(-)